MPQVMYRWTKVCRCRPADLAAAESCFPVCPSHRLNGDFAMKIFGLDSGRPGSPALRRQIARSLAAAGSAALFVGGVLLGLQVQAQETEGARHDGLEEVLVT